MKCKKLTVVNVSSGSSWSILEMGGVNVSNGDAIYCEPNIANRMMTQYRGMLIDSGEMEMGSLSGGHYHIVKFSSMEPKIINDESKLNESSSDETEHETPADKADDRSMTGRGQRFKKKSKE